MHEDFARIEEEIIPYADKGDRVLLFARYDGENVENGINGSVTPLGFVALANPIRENAVKTFEYFKSQGVAIKVISGDNPRTVSRIAIQAGIESAESFVDAATLDTEDKIADAVNKYTVFGRVTPKQKKQLVKALQAKGHTVAMTGDGVNDILAMKDADCSVAMASGSEAAAQAAQVVLLDSDFAHMPDVVYEGRRVVNNIQRSDAAATPSDCAKTLFQDVEIFVAAVYKSDGERHFTQFFQILFFLAGTVPDKTEVTADNENIAGFQLFENGIFES